MVQYDRNRSPEDKSVYGGKDGTKYKVNNLYKVKTARLDLRAQSYYYPKRGKDCGRPSCIGSTKSRGRKERARAG